MKLNLINFGKRHARVPQNVRKVPFKELYPLKLKDEVKTGSSIKNVNTCQYEMMSLMGCLKDNDFNNQPCSKELVKFYECVSVYDTHRKEQKKFQKSNIPTPKTVNFTSSQLTYFLRKYPTV